MTFPSLMFLLQVEVRGADISLDHAVGLSSINELVSRDEVRGRLVAVRGDGLRDGDGQALVTTSDVKGPGGLLASALGHVGKLTDTGAGQHGAAVLGLGLHGAGLQKAK